MRNISVIIPTYNAEKYIKNLLISLKNQNLGEFDLKEIIVIDSSSKDKTREIAEKLGAKVYKIPKSEFDHGGTRAKAGKLAKGDILIYLTQDALPANKNTIKNIAKVFKDDSIGAAYGKQIPYKETNIFGKHLRKFNYREESYIKSYEDKKIFGIKATFISNSFSAYKKSVLEKIGWFKDSLIFGEDQIAGAFILKSGYKIAYVSDAIVFHSHSYSILEDFKRYFDVGVFHKMENWLIEEFGKPEGEGLNYIKSEIKYILENKPYMIFESLIRNILKYAGYRLGYHHNILPIWIIKMLSMHPDWWEKANNRVNK